MTEGQAFEENFEFIGIEVVDLCKQHLDGCLSD